MQTNQTTVVHFIADGEVKEFPFNFRIFEAGDVDVYLDETLTDSGYNVTIDENNGGKVVFSAPPLNGTRITIIRNLDIKRTSDFQEGGAFRAKVINYELDYQVATLEQLDEKLNRSITCPPYVQDGINMQLPMPSSGKALVWNQDATALTNSLTNIDNAYTTVTTAQAEAKNSENNAKNSEFNAKQSELVVSNLAQELAQKLKKATFGNIGDIKYTSRTDVPNGGAWCDGAEYTQEMFPDIYQMLVDGKISSTDYTTFDNSVSTNGACGLFGFNEETASFKVPLLKDVYIKLGQTPLMFGAESLPNIKGTFEPTSHKDDYPTSGAFYKVGAGNSYSEAAQAGAVFGFDASRSSTAYQDGAKVNPDHVVYRAYVVLYASAAEPSVAITQDILNGRASANLSNITAEAKDLIAGLGMPSEKYIDISSQVLPDAASSTHNDQAPADGYIVFGVDTNPSSFWIQSYNKPGNLTTDEGLIMSVTLRANGCICLPIAKGQYYSVRKNGGTTFLCNFVYAQGAK